MNARLALLAMVARLEAAAWPSLVGRAYHELATKAHPDVGGSDEAMRNLTEARDALLAKAGKVAPVASGAPVPLPKATDIRPLEEARRCWCCVAPAEARLEDVLAPDWLAAKLKQLKPLDRIEVTHAKGDFIVEGLVLSLDAEAQALVWKPLRIIDLSGVPTIGPDWETATVTYEGDVQRWAVRLGGKIAKSGWESEAMAQAYLSAKRMARAA